MGYFRRLPLVLRAAGILGLLFPIASVTLLVWLMLTSLALHPHVPVTSYRVSVIAVDLGMLGGACGFAVNAYTLRFRHPGSQPFPLDSWRRQVLAIAIPAALPLCAILLALVIPPESVYFGLAYGVSVLGAWGLIAGFILLATRSGGALTRMPRTR